MRRGSWRSPPPPSPTGDLGIAAPAARLRISERTYARIFSKETGQSPAQFVLAARTERAKARWSELTG